MNQELAAAPPIRDDDEGLFGVHLLTATEQ